MLRKNVLGRPKTFLSFYKKMHNIFCFILFYRISYDQFCSIKIKITTFDRLAFMFVQRCIVVKDVSVKERHFPDNRKRAS